MVQGIIACWLWLCAHIFFLLRAKLITNTATQMVESQEVQRLKRVIAQLKAGAHVELESTFGDPSNNLDEKMDDDGVLEKEDG